MTSLFVKLSSITVDHDFSCVFFLLLFLKEVHIWQFPSLHQDGIRNIFFSWPRILGWMLNGVTTATIIYCFTTNAILDQAFRSDGRVAGSELLGATMYTCVVWAVNCQLALCLSYFTWIQHLFIWGSIFFWYIFLVIYGFFPPTISTTAYRVFLEACVSSPLYWLSSLCIVVAALLPYFSYLTFQTVFSPKCHHSIQRAKTGDS